MLYFLALSLLFISFIMLFGNFSLMNFSVGCVALFFGVVFIFPLLNSSNHYWKESKRAIYYNRKENYLLIEENKNPSIIVSSSITVPYNQYLDDKENIIYWLNEFLYDDILTHTIFEKELNNKNDKYKWN